MLNIYYGNMPEAIFNTEVYFKNVYEDEWITDSVAREMILDVDKSIVLDGAVIDRLRQMDSDVDQGIKAYL